MEFEQLKVIISRVLSVDTDEILLSSSFTDDLGADSLDLYQVVMQIEEEFSVVLKEEEIENIKIVEEALNMIKMKKPLD